MKFVLAPNAFKGGLSSVQACRAMARGVEQAAGPCDIVQVPFSDGGDGLVDVFCEVLGAQVIEARVTGPLGEALSSTFAYVPERRLAAVEMAKASGLALLPEERRNPELTTTFGTGELILQAIDRGAESVVVGIGGSATNDGGAGMAAALGVRFFDSRGRALVPQGGRDLTRIDSLDASRMDPRLKGIAIDVVCDVANPLLGKDGAARVYGPQKGAGPEQVESLEAGLAKLAEVIERELGLNVRSTPGAGAAGGLGAGLQAFLGAALRRGVEVMLDVVGLENHLDDADCLLTGEGRADGQLLYGKGPAGVGLCAKKRGLPCLLLAGSVDERCPDLSPSGITAVISICPGPMGLNKAMERAEENLQRATEQVVRVFLAGRGQYGEDAG